MKKLVLAALAFVVLGASTAEASYVCGTVFQGNNGAGGKHGWVWFSLYSGPHCTGNFELGRYICSTGSTAGWCPANNDFTAEAIVAMAEATREAAFFGQRVTITTRTPCNDPQYQGCFTSLYFWGN